MVCTFFGHRQIHKDISELIENAVVNIMEKENVDMFYVGNNGVFDKTVLDVLKKLKEKYPYIDYAVVLAYLPKNTDKKEDYIHTIYPEGLEKTPPRFAIVRRNQWMIDRSDYVIAYVKTIGGAKQFMELAQDKGKTVINLADE